jgi:hypothetical protein
MDSVLDLGARLGVCGEIAAIGLESCRCIVGVIAKTEELGRCREKAGLDGGYRAVDYGIYGIDYIVDKGLYERGGVSSEVVGGKWAAGTRGV